jgi:sortase A
MATISTSKQFPNSISSNSCSALTMRLHRALRTSGLMLVSAGAFVLLFVAFQLWGTGLYQAQHQSQLRDEISHILPQSPKTQGKAPLSQTPQSALILAPHIAAPQMSHPIGTIRIPSINLNQVIIEGVGENDLSLGPGHYPGTPLPGEAGNSAIAGHRTTWGHPFYNLNEVGPHDRIIVTTVQGTFTYLPIAHQVVLPSDVKVLAPSRLPELTLTTCNPRFSAAQRLVVIAKLVGSSFNSGRHPSRRTYPTTVHSPSTSSVGDLNIPLTVGEGLACIFIAILLLISRRRISRKLIRRSTYVAGSAALLFFLFLFFSSVSLSLPASF